MTGEVSAGRRAPPLGTLAILSALYFVQGLPFGFQANALPVFLREAGLSLGAVGLSRLLTIPWSVKPLWGPLVDRYGWAPFGRRKTWIIPLQLLLALALMAAAHSPPARSLDTLLGVVLIINLFASTQDVAVDGLAVSTLNKDELGLGNTAQVVGYKLGMLAGGGLLVALAGTIGWAGMFYAMAAASVVTMLLLLLWREPAHVEVGNEGPVVSLWGVLRAFFRWLTAPGAVTLIAFVATYKVGEAMADAMFGPFLKDHGFTPAQIGLWVGTWGMVASVLGSLTGGYLASRYRLLTAVGIAAAFRVVPLLMQAALAGGALSLDETNIIAATCAEHFFGGALTTAMFAYMMSRVDRRIGATHFTALAAIEVLGKSPGSLVSGFIAEAYGFAFVFSLAAGLSLAYLLLLWPMRRAERLALHEG